MNDHFGFTVYLTFLQFTLLMTGFGRLSSLSVRAAPFAQRRLSVRRFRWLFTRPRFTPTQLKRRQMMREKNTQPDLKAFAAMKTGDKSYFTEIGAAWKNTKGGYHIKLNALPVAAEIILLPPKED